MVPTADDAAPAVGRHRRMVDSDDSDVEEGAASGSVLTAARASELCLPGKEYRLVASSGGFASIENLSSLKSLDYIDVRNNALTSLAGLGGNHLLKTVIAKANKLSNVDPLLRIAAIRVLNLAENMFATTEWLPRATFSPELLTLVMSGNRLVALEGLACVPELRVLIIGHNDIENIAPVARLIHLTKLSASHNRIRAIPDSFQSLQLLLELRLAHNRISCLPSREVLARLSALKILDLGHNRLVSVDNIDVLRETLTHFNIKGNPLCKDDPEGYQDTVLKLIPKLEILDGQRMAGGRRKVRINRQRREAGLRVEPERAFARAPSKYYANYKGQLPSNDLGLGAQTDRASETMVKGPTSADDSVKAHRKPKPITKRPKRPEPDEAEDVVQTEEFLRSAKVRTQKPVAAVQDFKVKVSSQPSGAKAKKRKVSESGKRAVETHDDFGSGGPSKWA